MITKYLGNGVIRWDLDLDAAEFYIGLFDDYARTHNDAGVRDDRDALAKAVEDARGDDDE